MTMKVSGKAADDRRGDGPNDGGDSADALERMQKGGPVICADRPAKLGSAGEKRAASGKVAGADRGEAVSAGSTPFGGPIARLFPSMVMESARRVGVEWEGHAAALTRATSSHSAEASTWPPVNRSIASASLGLHFSPPLICDKRPGDVSTAAAMAVSVSSPFRASR